MKQHRFLIIASAAITLSPWLVPLVIASATAAQQRAVFESSITSAPSAVKSVRLILPAQPGPVVEHIGQVVARQIQQRCEAKVVKNGDATLTVELAVAPGIGAEGYRIENCPGGGVRIVGNDERGVLYGVGKFLRSSRYDQGGFTPGDWRGTSAPNCPVHAIYMATRRRPSCHGPEPGNSASMPGMLVSKRSGLRKNWIMFQISAIKGTSDATT